MPGKAALLQKHDDDVVIVSAVRSAITKVRPVAPLLHGTVFDDAILGQERWFQGHQT